MSKKWKLPKFDESMMPCRIYLRKGQSIQTIESARNEEVTIYAPTWVKEGLQILGTKLKRKKFEVFDKFSDNQNPIESFVLNDESLSLTELQRVARNDHKNTTGIIKRENYMQINDCQLVYSLKNLVRQCVIVGKDETTHYGGYPKGFPRVKQSEPVYICDLSALQFQQGYNTGRQVLICEKPLYEGPIEALIFQNVVGEKKLLYNEVKGQDRRYVFVRSKTFGNCYFDTKAYRKFVANDVLLSGVALSEVASKKGDKLNFKFLKYGAGFYVGEFKVVVEEHILTGVIDGLELLFGKYPETMKTIKSVEFPFYTRPILESSDYKRLGNFSKEFGISYKFSKDDALKTSKSTGDVADSQKHMGILGAKELLITATTNCGSTHTVFGNAMGTSVDGVIAKNVKSEGNIFSPNLNKGMQENFVTLNA